MLIFIDDARKLIKQTSYWVYDSSTKQFAPSKFVGFKNMDFETYIKCKKGDRDKSTGIPFNGKFTREAIEDIIGRFGKNINLEHELKQWGKNLFGFNLFNNVNKTKWKFVSLPIKNG